MPKKALKVGDRVRVVTSPKSPAGSFNGLTGEVSEIIVDEGMYRNPNSHRVRFDAPPHPACPDARFRPEEIERIDG